MSLYKYAKSELDRIYSKKDLEEKDGIHKLMYKSILDLIKLFAKQGHSGASASYCRKMFNQLSSFKPLGKLTNNQEEWMEVDTNMYQSRRSPTCFSIDLEYYYDLDITIPKWKRLFIKNIKGMRLFKLNG